MAKNTRTATESREAARQAAQERSATRRVVGTTGTPTRAKGPGPGPCRCQVWSTESGEDTGCRLTTEGTGVGFAPGHDARLAGFLVQCGRAGVQVVDGTTGECGSVETLVPRLGEKLAGKVLAGLALVPRVVGSADPEKAARKAANEAARAEEQTEKAARKAANEAERRAEKARRQHEAVARKSERETAGQLLGWARRNA